MTTIHWKHGVSGDWSDAHDWSGDRVPGATDDVDVTASGNYTLTIDAAEAARSLRLDAADATIEDNAAFALGTTLTISAGIFKIGHGGSVNGGTVSIGTAGHLISRQGTLNAALIDDGTVKASGGTLTIDGLVTGSGHAIAAAGATLDFAGGANFSGNVAGAGTLLISGSNFTTLAGDLTAAKVVVDSGLSLTGGGSIGGSISGAGNLGLDGSESYTLVPGATLAVGLLGVSSELLIDGGTIGGNVLDYGGITVTSGTLVLDGTINDYGTPSVAADATLKSQGGGTLGYGISGTGTLDVAGTAPLFVYGSIPLASINVAAAATLGCNGTLVGAVTDDGTLMLAPGLGSLTLDNLAGGTGALQDFGQIILMNGASLSETISGTGTLTLDQGTYTLNGGSVGVGSLDIEATGVLSGNGTIAGVLDIGGVVEVTAGTLTFENQVDFGPTPGTLFATAGSVLDVTAGGSLYAGGAYGSIEGAGTLALTSASNGEFDLDDGTLSIASVIIQSSDLLLGGGDVLGSVTNNGSIATPAGTLNLEGAVSGNGDYIATGEATLNFLGGGTISGELGGGGTILLDSAITFGGEGVEFSNANVVATANIEVAESVNIINEYGGTFDIDAAANTTVTLSGSYPSGFLNDAGFAADGAGVADVSIGFTNSGNVSVDSGTLAFLGTLTNNSVMEVSAGTLSIATSVAGTGTLQLDASGTLSLQDGTGTGQTVDFLAAAGLVDLDTPISFEGVIAGFGGNNIIDLINTAETSFNYVNGVLTVKNGAETVASLQFSGNYSKSDFMLASDGHGGTSITFV